MTAKLLNCKDFHLWQSSISSPSSPVQLLHMCIQAFNLCSSTLADVLRVTHTHPFPSLPISPPPVTSTAVGQLIRHINWSQLPCQQNHLRPRPSPPSTTSLQYPFKQHSLEALTRSRYCVKTHTQLCFFPSQDCASCTPPAPLGRLEWT